MPRVNFQEKVVELWDSESFLLVLSFGDIERAYKEIHSRDLNEHPDAPA